MQESLASLLEKYLEDLSSKDLWTSAFSSYIKGEPVSHRCIEELLLDTLQESIDSVEKQHKALLKIFQICVLTSLEIELFKAELKNALKNVMYSGAFLGDTMSQSLVNLIASFLEVKLTLPDFDPTDFSLPQLAKASYILVFDMLAAALQKDQNRLKSLYAEVKKQTIYLDHTSRPWTALWQTSEQHSKGKVTLAYYLLYFCAARIFGDDELAVVRDRLLSIVEKEGMTKSAAFLGFMIKWVEKTIAPKLITPTPANYPLCDQSKAVVGYQSEQQSSIFTLLGDRTSLGALSFHKMRIVSFGPQRFPLSDISSFGIDQKNVEAESHKIELMSSDQKSFIRGWVHLPDSSQWMQVTAESEKGRSSLQCYLRGSREEEVALVFYVRASVCEIPPAISIYPQSLDHFRGMLKTISFSDNRSKITFRTSVEEEVQLIPLVGEGYFWDADFLLSFALKKGQENIKIDIQSESDEVL